MRNPQLMFLNMLGHIWEIDSYFSIHWRLWLLWFNVSDRKKTLISAKYKVKNWMKIVKSFLAAEEYASLIEIQNGSLGNSSYLLLKSMVTRYKSIYNFKWISDKIFMKGFWIQ